MEVVLTTCRRLSRLVVSGLPGGERSLPPSQAWSAQPALEADASVCAQQRSVFCQWPQKTTHKHL